MSDDPWYSLRDQRIRYCGEIWIEIDLMTGFFYITFHDDADDEGPRVLQEIAWSWPEAWGIATGYEWGVMDNCRWVVRLRTPATVH
jgi:hypothetical protein